MIQNKDTNLEDLFCLKNEDLGTFPLYVALIWCFPYFQSDDNINFILVVAVLVTYVYY